jgi:hypothetical protein
MTITLSLEASEYRNIPSLSNASKRDIVIEIPLQGEIRKLNERYFPTSKPTISRGTLTPEEKSGRKFTKVEFNLIEDGYTDRKVILLWIEERNEWVAISYRKWEESIFYEETYGGPYELGDFSEKKLLDAYDVHWQLSTIKRPKYMSPNDYIIEIIFQAANSQASTLNLSNKEIQDLPSEIGQLHNLESLQINFNQLSSLPSEIGQLKNLISLGIISNNLVQLPPEIGLLSNLEYLHVGGNQLNVLPSEIGKLSNLETLILIKNKLSELPSEINQLRKLQYLNLELNPIPIPVEIVYKKRPSIILDYYFSSLKKHFRINEVKLLIIGQGSVGKTSLVQQILHSTFDQNQTKTEGISINQWQVEGSQKRETEAQSETLAPGASAGVENRKSEIKLNIWDFGGQEIMHATHQFFLTKRSLYLLVLDARLTQEEKPRRVLAQDHPVLRRRVACADRRQQDRPAPTRHRPHRLAEKISEHRRHP